VEREYTTAINDLHALTEIGERYGVEPAPTPERSIPWSTLNRQEATLRVLGESGRPLRLSEIVSHLRSMDRTDDTVHLISAALAALKRKGLVVSEMRGVWRTVAEEQILLPDSLLGHQTEGSTS
jgi:hypothetical protein